MSEQRIDGIVEELASGRFDDVERRSHDWSHTYERETYLRLLSTYSDHRLLAEEQRKGLFLELGELIDSEYAGAVERPYRTELILARRVR